MSRHKLSYCVIVPNYWAEAKRKTQIAGKAPMLVRRFGWSDLSEEDAALMAQERLDDACARLQGGEQIQRAEYKRPYNGAAGMPIREEILDRVGDSVITRNTYGARCLNTPNLLFADIDFEFVRAPSIFPRFLQALFPSRTADPLAYSRKQLELFIQRNPAWNLRIYRSPAGLRIMATHAPMDPRSPEVVAFFSAIQADQLYVHMCKNQNCFRARLTAKPWRIGIDRHMPPRPGIWPVHPSRLEERTQWVTHYERQAANYAACHFIESIGSGKVDFQLRRTMELHDSESRATRTNLKIA